MKEHSKSKAALNLHTEGWLDSTIFKSTGLPILYHQYHYVSGFDGGKA